MRNITSKTRLLGVLGNPIKHSLSPLMMNAAFEEKGIDAVYLGFEVDNLEAAVKGAKALGFLGLNITVPFKEKVLPFLNSLSPDAAQIGAVNTVCFEKEPEGQNTDGLGFIRALEEKGVSLQKAKVLVLGAGGASKAVSFAAAGKGAEVTVANRTVSKAEELASAIRKAGHSANACSLDPISLEGYSLLVNATSIGLKGEPSPVQDIPKGMAVMDLVYKETDLVSKAEQAGAEIVPGIDMLLHQGAASFELWFGEKAPLKVMRSALTRGMHGQDASEEKC